MIIVTDADMRAFGEMLAQDLKQSDWVAINGPLGAGKTVLCAGILAGLGFAGEVASPSYAIVHSYEPPDVSIAVAHVDLYFFYDIDVAILVVEIYADDVPLVQVRSMLVYLSCKLSQITQTEPIQARMCSRLWICWVSTVDSSKQT